MATNRADPDSDGAALFSMDDLRARLDAPLFHRDQGLATPAQLPRLRELSFGHAEVPLPQELPDAAVVETPPEVPLVKTPERELPKLASFGDLMSASAPPKEPEVLAVPESEAAAPWPQPVVSAPPPALGPTETQALLAVLATLESNANKLHATGAQLVEAEVSVVSEAIMPLPVAELNITPANGSHSSIEAELNRLAFLPDQEEPVGRVEVPEIAIARVEPRKSTGVPVLSQHEMYNPRATQTMATSKRAVFEATFDGTASRRRSKKGAVRRLTSLVLALGLLGGGLYAAKYYLLDPKWDPDVKVLVDDVEAARQLEFDHAVDVTSLAADDYATRIASYALDIQGGNQEQVGSEMRALGLLSGVLDLRAIGLSALPETPAFYDVASEQIYIVTGLPLETYRFAMYRALATALLDQRYGWGGRIDGAAPSVVRGTRALYEGDALVTALTMLTASESALVLEQRAGLFATYGGTPTPSQFATTAAGRLGVSLRAFVEAFPPAERDMMLRDATITDGQALDLRRLLRGVADAAADPQDVLRRETLPGAGSRGMLFWYHVLASRLDVATAWNKALLIQGDDVVVTPGATGYCVAATLTVSPEALEGVSAAFTAWASTALAESATTVVPSLADGVGRIALSACDVGLAVAMNNGQVPLSLGGAPLRAEQYRLVRIMQPTLTNAQAACAVYGADVVSASDERMVVDAVEGWTAPAAHPAPDPSRAECTVA